MADIFHNDLRENKELCQSYFDFRNDIPTQRKEKRGQDSSYVTTDEKVESLRSFLKKENSNLLEKVCLFYFR